MGKTTKYWPLIIFIIVWFVFSYKFFLKGLIPAPLDFLTNFYNPWQGYEDYPIKNPAIPDIVSQIIPWKIYSIESFKKGIIPFWNPYNFSGTPHLANFQSAIFNPFNIFFFIFSFSTAWSLVILFQPLMAGIFTYFFARKIGLEKKSSLLSSICFAFCGFLTVWLEYGTLGWAIVWLPLNLFFWECFWESKKLYYWLAINLIFSFSLLSGHLQISLYLLLANFFYLIFALIKKTKMTKKILFLSFSSFILPFFLTAFQLLPTMELYAFSPRSIQIPTDWFKGLQIPFSYLLTLIFPDFFGHPATRNLWGKGSYVEMMGYIGFLPILMVFFYLWERKKTILGKEKSAFFIWLALFSLLTALPTPFSFFLVWLKIPVLSSSAPSRIICLICFSLSILAGFGMEHFLSSLKSDKGKIKKFLWLILAIFILLLALTYFINKISFRNIIFSFTIFLAFFAITWIFISKKENQKLFSLYCLLFIVLVFFDLFRFWHKFNPFINKERFYPNLPIINFVKQNAGIYRTFGLFLGNLGLPFEVNSLEGYDSLNLTEYQQLLIASQDGNSTLPPRSTGESLAKKGKYSKNLIDLLGVKYITSGKSDLFAFPTWEYPESFKLVWEDKNYQIFENKNVVPRFFLTDKYKIVAQDNFLTATLENRDYRDLVLTEDPKLDSKNNNETTINLKKYQEGRVYFETSSSSDNLLFLSDTFYPGWEAYVDGIQTSILKANYVFRSVRVPSGNHEVEFIYQPKLFKIGIFASFFTLLTMIFFIFFDKLFLRHKQ